MRRTCQLADSTSGIRREAYPVEHIICLPHGSKEDFQFRRTMSNQSSKTPQSAISISCLNSVVISCSGPNLTGTLDFPLSDAISEGLMRLSQLAR
ncbi:hypothetical protein ElyMa_002395400 [Elysia marginata]|uniref:Uncharacterized protein n=1 Tax=Elysia marginata TaxID=1093978 RepID=A0AAV4GEX3_9GAST|nr:hypothetical protein ElyMa_002395400 [Elysia marginata]